MAFALAIGSDRELESWQINPPGGPGFTPRGIAAGETPLHVDRSNIKRYDFRREIDGNANLATLIRHLAGDRDR